MKQRSTATNSNRSKQARAAARGLHAPRVLSTVLNGVLNAPTDVAGFRYVKLPRTSTTEEGDSPQIPTGYRRHGLSRVNGEPLNPDIGFLDLDDISVTWNRHLRSKVFGGGVKEVAWDGADLEQYFSNTGMDKSGVNGGTFYGIQYSGRYLTFGSRVWSRMGLEIDEMDGSPPRYLEPPMSWPVNNLQVTIDLLRYKNRRIVIRGGGNTWFSGFSTEFNIQPTPYNFLADKPTFAFMGDSYWQSSAYNLVGMDIAELFTRLSGGVAHEASVWGGTGFAASGDDGLPFDDERRLQPIIQARPDVVVLPGGINDGWPTYNAQGKLTTGKSTAEAIHNVAVRLRTELPATVLVFCTPFQPKESAWNNPDGTPRQLRLGVLAEFNRTPGPCIFLDGWLGGWRTSNGHTNLFDSGPWQTGDGYAGAPTGVGFGDTWTTDDQTHITEVGTVGLVQVMTRSFRAAMSALGGNRQYGFELPLAYRTAQPGVYLDFGDLTDAKLAWKKNMATETEFRNGVTDAPGRGGTGTITPSSLSGFAGALTLTRDSYAYKQAQFVAGQQYTVSVMCYVQGGVAPVFSSGEAGAATNDFSLVGKNDALGPVTYTVSEQGYGTGVYRVSATFVSALTALSNWGVVKYGTNTARTVQVTGYQLEKGTLTGYQPLSDVATEFAAAFPIHATYQDNVGMVPVWSVEQKIGMQIDMRMGGARGLVDRNVNGTFLGTVTAGMPAGWTATGGATVTTANGIVTIGPLAATGGIVQDTAVPVGGSVEVRIVARKVSGTSDVTLWANGAAANGNSRVITGPVFQEYSWRLIGTANMARVLLQVAAGSGVLEVKSVSIRDLPGNHLVQSVPDNRPTLDARMNRLVYSESLSNAVWTKVAGIGLVENTDIGPNGVTLATLTGVAAATAYIQQKDIAATANSQGWVSAFIKVGTSPASMLAIYNNAISTMLSRVVINWTAGVPSVGTLLGTWTTAPTIEATSVAGVYRIHGQFPVGANTAVAVLYYPSAANAAESSKVNGFQVAFNTTAARPAYQRIGAATDYDGVGVMKGARFNGSTTFMQIAGFDLSTVAQIVASASMRRDSDAAVAVAFEHGPSATATTGTFAMFAPNPASNVVGWRVNGATSTNAISANVPAAPSTAVLTGYADLPGSIMGLRRDGVVVATDAASRGAGNFTNQTFYVGCRAGSGLYFSGVIYRLGVRGGNYDTFMTLQERLVNEPVKTLP